MQNTAIIICNNLTTTTLKQFHPHSHTHTHVQQQQPQRLSITTQKKILQNKKNIPSQLRS